MKILCVMLPHFPWHCEVRRLVAHTDLPAVLVYASGSQKLVLDYAPVLNDLQADIPLQQALSLYGRAAIIQANLPYYRSVWHGLLDGLEQKSPLVEGVAPGTAYLGLDGMQGIYPDDNALIASVREVIPADFAPQMGIARNKFLASLAALNSQPGGCRILNGHVDVFLRNLATDILPVSARSKLRLHEFGYHRLGQIAALPLGPLQAQFGPEGRRIWELAQGIDETPLYPRSTTETMEVSTMLSSVTVSLETILATVEVLLGRVFARGSLHGKGIRNLVLWTRGLDAEHWERHVRFKEPAMEVRSAITRIKQFLESNPQPGPVEQLGIKLTGVGCGLGRQSSIFNEVRAQEYLQEDIKQLELRLESPQVFVIKEVEPWSRLPERQYALMPLRQ